MSWQHCGIWVLLGLLSNILPGQMPPQSKIEALAHQLTSPDYELRESATKKLRLLGEAAHASLNRIKSTLPLEGRLRVEDILAAPPEEAPILAIEPTLVSCDFKDAPAERILQELAQCVGFQISPNVATGMTLPTHMTFKVEEMPFLEAMDQLCNEYQWGFNLMPQTNQISLYQRTLDKRPPVAFVGPLRVEATAFSQTRHTSFVTEPTERCNLQLRIDTDPKTPVIGVLYPITKATGKTDEGQDLVFIGNPNNRTYMQTVHGRSRAHVSLTLDPVSPTCKELLGVAVPIRCVVPKEILESRVLTTAAQGDQAPRTGALQVRIQKLLQHDDRQEIEISFAPPAPTGPDLNNLSPSWERVVFRTSSFQEIPARRIRMQKSNDGYVTCAYTLPLKERVGVVEVQALKTYRIIRYMAELPTMSLR